MKLIKIEETPKKSFRVHAGSVTIVSEERIFSNNLPGESFWRVSIWFKKKEYYAIIISGDMEVAGDYAEFLASVAAFG